MKDADEEYAALSVIMHTDIKGPELVAPTRTSLSRVLSEWLRHPLILLLISSAVIPSFVYLLSRYRDLTESRQKAALEIVNKNSVCEAQLYALFTELGLFHQTNQVRKPAAKDLDDLQTGLDKTWTGHYLEFRKSYPDAHTWVDDLYSQGAILRLFSSRDVKTLFAVTDKDKLPAALPADLKKLSDDVEDYKGALSDSLGQLTRLRDQCISKGYDFEPNGKTSSLQIEVTNQLNQLRNKRSAIISDMARIFSP